jgi:hypothetical protein
MPLPKVVFTEDSSAKQREQVLLQMEQALELPGVSAVKTQVLRSVINFARKNLVHARPKDFSPAVYQACHVIFNRANLPDLLFLHYVISRINAIRNDTSGLRKTVLPMAQNYRRPLILPLVRQMEKATFSFGIAVLFMRNEGLNLPAIATYFASEGSAEARIHSLLDGRLILEHRKTFNSGMDDDFGDGIELIVDRAHRTGRAALGFFNRVSQTTGTVKPALQGPNTRFQPET